jgi:hypothetical protein
MKTIITTMLLITLLPFVLAGNFTINAQDIDTLNPIQNFSAVINYESPPIIDLWEDLSGTDTGNWVGTDIVLSLLCEQEGCYTGIYGGNKFGFFNFSNGIWENLTYTTIAGTNLRIRGIIRYNDTTLYLATENGGRILRYNLNNNTVDLILTTTDGIENLRAIDIINDTLYFGGTYSSSSASQLFSYNVTSSTFNNLSGVDTSDWASNTGILSISVYNDIAIYTGLAAGKFGVYNPQTNVWSDLSATDTGDWVGTSAVNSVFAYSDTAVYTGLAAGKFGVYNPQTNVWSDLSATDTGDWVGTSAVNSVFAYSDTAVYTGLAAGKFGVYNPQTNVWSDLSATDTANWVGTSNLFSVFAYNDTMVYTGLASGKFGVYNPPIQGQEITLNYQTSSFEVVTDILNNQNIIANITIESQLYSSRTYMDYDTSNNLTAILTLSPVPFEGWNFDLFDEDNNQTFHLFLAVMLGIALLVYITRSDLLMILGFIFYLFSGVGLYFMGINLIISIAIIIIGISFLSMIENKG